MDQGHLWRRIGQLALGLGVWAGCGGETTGPASEPNKGIPDLRGPAAPAKAKAASGAAGARGGPAGKAGTR
jgi:hypothetical protein